MFGICASIAEFARELIRGRVKSALALAKLRGKVLGRPPSQRGPPQNCHSPGARALKG
ncbi:MAG: hypothetical protein ABSG77_11545 [Candidatus Acidiferrum sp.]